MFADLAPRAPRWARSVVLLGVIVMACADDASAPVGGSCQAFGSLCTMGTYTAWLHNAAAPPPVFESGTTNSCFRSMVLCNYLYPTQGGPVQRDVIDCHASHDVRGLGIYVRLRLRASISEQPMGQVLRLGRDFSIEQLYHLYQDRNASRPTARFDARLPIAGELTLTVIGPPRHAFGGVQSATIPTMRIEGQVCGAPLNVVFRAETREIDFL